MMCFVLIHGPPGVAGQAIADHSVVTYINPGNGGRMIREASKRERPTRYAFHLLYVWSVVTTP